jgi:hypothetical protein
MYACCSYSLAIEFVRAFWLGLRLYFALRKRQYITSFYILDHTMSGSVDRTKSIKCPQLLIANQHGGYPSALRLP